MKKKKVKSFHLISFKKKYTTYTHTNNTATANTYVNHKEMKLM